MRQVAYEYLRSNLLRPFVLARLVNLNWLVEELDHVKNLDRVISVFFGLELDKAITLMLVSDFISRYVHVDDGPSLEEQLPNDLLVHPRLQIANIYCGLLISFEERAAQSRQRRMLIHITGTSGSRLRSRISCCRCSRCFCHFNNL